MHIKVSVIIPLSLSLTDNRGVRCEAAGLLWLWTVLRGSEADGGGAVRVAGASGERGGW